MFCIQPDVFTGIIGRGGFPSIQLKWMPVKHAMMGKSKKQ